MSPRPTAVALLPRPPPTVARGAARLWYRADYRHAAVVRRHPPAPDASVELGASELHDALSKLSLRQRQAVVLRYWGDLPEAEIAEILGIRRGSVASLLHRALADLRKVIEL